MLRSSLTSVPVKSPIAARHAASIPLLPVPRSADRRRPPARRSGVDVLEVALQLGAGEGRRELVEVGDKLPQLGGVLLARRAGQRRPVAREAEEAEGAPDRRRPA